MFYKKISIVLLISCTCMLGVAGCNDQESGKNSIQANKTKYEGGHLGILDANPNLPTSPSYHTYDQDVKLMRNVLDTFTEIRKYNIVINGKTANVHVLYNRGIPNIRQLQQKIHQSLSHQMPRYEIKLSSKSE